MTNLIEDARRAGEENKAKQMFVKIVEGIIRRYTSRLCISRDKRIQRMWRKYGKAISAMKRISEDRY